MPEKTVNTPSPAEPWCWRLDGGAAAGGRRPQRQRTVEEMLQGKRRGTEGHRVRAQLADVDGCLREPVAQRVALGRGADPRQDPGAEQQPGPATQNDPLRPEKVDQVRDSRAEIERGLIENLGGPVGSRGDQRGERGLL